MWRFKIPYCTFLTFYESPVKYSSFSGTEVESLVYSIQRKLGGRKNIVAEFSHTFEVSDWKLNFSQWSHALKLLFFKLRTFQWRTIVDQYDHMTAGFKDHGSSFLCQSLAEHSQGNAKISSKSFVLISVDHVNLWAFLHCRIKVLFIPSYASKNSTSI